MKIQNWKTLYIDGFSSHGKEQDHLRKGMEIYV